jgi:hypothetical protein
MKLTYFICFLLIKLNTVNGFVTKCNQRIQFNKYGITKQIDLVKKKKYHISLHMSGYRPFWEDDLPNLFGINPIEASVLFGILYYLYGPEELYGYAREAGKFFSTYVPIIRDLAVSIFNEFKDYIEEDRQRDEMAKRGVDLTNFPRRTTNIVERIQESLTMFSEMTKVENGLTEEIQEGLRPELFTEESESSTPEQRSKNRKKKKAILESKNIDVAKLLESNNNSPSQDMTAELELNKSLNLVQERFQLITAARESEIIENGLFGSNRFNNMRNPLPSGEEINDNDFEYGPAFSTPTSTPPILPSVSGKKTTF